MIIEQVNTALPLPIAPFLVGVTLSAADQKIVQGVVAAVQHLETLKGDYVNRNGAVDIVARAEREFGENPSTETRDAIALANVRALVFDDTRKRIERTANTKRDAAIASVGVVAAKVIDQIAENLTKAEADHQKAVSKSPFGEEVSNESLGLRLRRTRDELGLLRGRCLNDLAGLDTLCRFGLAQDPFELAEVAALDDIDPNGD